MSLLSIPRKVRIKLKKIQKESLWGDFGKRRKIHLVSWSYVCRQEAWMVRNKKLGGP